MNGERKKCDSRQSIKRVTWYLSLCNFLYMSCLRLESSTASAAFLHSLSPFPTCTVLLIKGKKAQSVSVEIILLSRVPCEFILQHNKIRSRLPPHFQVFFYESISSVKDTPGVSFRVWKLRGCVLVWTGRNRRLETLTTTRGFSL